MGVAACARITTRSTPTSKSGDRSEKIRTYNFPQDRITDHRVGHTAHNLARVMQGELEDFLAVVRTKLQAEKMVAEPARA